MRYKINDDSPANLAAPSGLRVLKPTEAATELYSRFVTLRQGCLNARKIFQDRLERGKPRRTVIRLGVPATIAYRLCATALSCWPQLFGDELELRIEVDTSVELMRRLDAGSVLSCVISYGSKNPKRLESKPMAGQEFQRFLERDLQVCFRSFDYELRTTLLCHAATELVTKAGSGVNQDRKDLNKDYWRTMQDTKKKKKDAWNKWKKERSNKGRQIKIVTPFYDELKEIDPLDIDFTHVPLIAVPSYGEAPGIQQIVDEVRSRFGVRDAFSYDEALALVRAGQGVSFAVEPYCTRDHINAFRLPSIGNYGRYFGVYYNTREGLTKETLRVVNFLRGYLKTFEYQIRATGQFPAYGEPEYANWWQTYKGERIPGAAEWLNPLEFPKCTE